MTTYFKLLGKDKTNRGLKYHRGLNVDPHPFNSDVTQDCVSGGIYFSTVKDILKHLSSDHEWLAELTVPENAPIFEFKDKSWAHQVFITNFYDRSKVSTWKYLVKNGADIHTCDDEVMRWAARTGHLSVVKYLVKKGANIHTAILRMTMLCKWQWKWAPFCIQVSGEERCRYSCRDFTIWLL